MTEATRFTLDGREVEAGAGETLWQVAARHGIDIPHLCWLPEPGYRADGNCRACMVEIEGERVLAASCIRKPAAGMKAHTGSERARTARRMVMELLLADQPPRADAHDHGSRPLAVGGAPGDRGEPLPDARAMGARQLPPGDGGESRRLHPVQSLRARLPRGAGQRRHRPRLSRPRGQDRLRPGRPDGALDLRRLRRVRAGLPDGCLDAFDAGRSRPRAAAIGGSIAASTASAPIAGSAARSPITSATTPSPMSPAGTGPRTKLACASRVGSASTMSVIRSG